VRKSSLVAGICFSSYNTVNRTAFGVRGSVQLVSRGWVLLAVQLHGRKGEIGAEVAVMSSHAHIAM